MTRLLVEWYIPRFISSTNGDFKARTWQGNQVRYRANRECPVFAELAGLFRRTSGLVGVPADALRPLHPAPGLELDL